MNTIKRPGENENDYWKRIAQQEHEARERHRLIRSAVVEAQTVEQLRDALLYLLDKCEPA